MKKDSRNKMYVFHTQNNDQRECWRTHKEEGCDDSQEPTGGQDNIHSLLFLIRKFAKTIQ